MAPFPKRQGLGQIEKRRQPSQWCIGCDFHRGCLSDGFIDHRVDGEVTIVFEQRPNGTVDCVPPFRFCVLISRQPCKNGIAPYFRLGVWVQQTRTCIVVHGPANARLFFELPLKFRSGFIRLIHEGLAFGRTIACVA